MKSLRLLPFCHWYYLNEEVILRELISNSPDALSKVEDESFGGSSNLDSGKELHINPTPANKQ